MVYCGINLILQVKWCKNRAHFILIVECVDIGIYFLISLLNGIVNGFDYVVLQPLFTVWLHRQKNNTH